MIFEISIKAFLALAPDKLGLIKGASMDARAKKTQLQLTLKRAS